MQIFRINIPILLISFFIILFLVGVVNAQPVEVSEQIANPSVQSGGEIEPNLTWTTIPLTDLKTGERFTVEELVLQKKPLIINTFAVWCPSCTMQERITTELQQKNPGKYTVLSIDIDPNENADIVKKHVEKNNLEGKYAVTQIEFTKGLVDSFGTDVALRMPQTIIISNRTASCLGGGVFSADGIAQVIAQLG
jgi:thiol-disulfide isomerase/thioredoxin